MIQRFRNTVITRCSIAAAIDALTSILAVQLTPQRAQDFYGEHKGKSFFDTLVNFMTSGPVYALVLARQNAIKEWRSLMGPTNSNTARAEKPKRYSIQYTCNVVHSCTTLAYKLSLANIDGHSFVLCTSWS